MKSLLAFSALALLSACTYNNDRPTRSSDELARLNDAGQNIAPDSTMYQQQPAYQGDTPPRVIVVPVYHNPNYYQSQPQRYYSDPHSVYNDPHSSLYHRNYGHDGYARAQTQVAAEASHYSAKPSATAPAPRFYRYKAAPTPSVTTPKVYRYAGAPAPTKAIVGPSAPASRTFTMPKATMTAPMYSAPARTYTAPTTARTYTAPARPAAPAPTYRPAPTYHYTPSAPTHH